MSGAALRRLLGSALGVGRVPGPAGTWGSLATVLAVVALFGLAGAGEGWAGRGLLADSLVERPTVSAGWWWPGLVAVACLTLIGVLVGQRAAADWGVDDPGSFVLDEVAGQLLALLPLLPGPLDPLGLATAFVAFRLFDIWKPPPVGALERLPGGAGIMADDLAAGLIAMLGVAIVA